MKHILLSHPTGEQLSFYLAAEEVIARHFSQEECFFTWVVGPTVIFGRNQVMENEVNLPYCKEKGIQLVQRKSGGGCVYADEGNVMMSYVTPLEGKTVEEVFADYLEKAAGSLRKLSKTFESFENSRCVEASKPRALEASKRPVLGDFFAEQIHTSGRNDILLGERKISGSALYVTPDKRHAIAHGTLLHSTNIERMVRAITPSAEKLAKNGVASVRQRVTNLAEHIHITIPELRQHLIATLCDSEATFTNEMVAEAEELMKTYFTINNH